MLSIVHLNDTEGGWLHAASGVRKHRADLILHAGDISLGYPHGWPAVTLMNDLHIDAITPGNHDLDCGIEALHEQLRALNASALCANVQGAPEGCFKPYQIFERQGFRIAVVGVTQPDMSTLVPARLMPGMVFLPTDQVLQEIMPHLRSQADLVICLSHCGFDADCAIAKAVEGIDIIVGGHSHHLLVKPVQVGRTWVAQSGAHGSYVGLLEVSWVDGLVQVRGRVLPTAELAPDPLALSLQPAELDTTVMGYTTTDLRRADFAQETPLGNVTVDLLRDYAQADLGLLRCSSVHNALPPGPITQHDLSQFNHCGNDRVARLELAGHELMQVLEYGARDAYYLLTLSGAHAVYDGARIVGERVRAVSVGDAPLETHRTYSVACSEVLALGGAGFVPLQGKPFTLLPQTVNDLLSDHLALRGTLSPALDGRLVIHGELPRRP